MRSSALGWALAALFFGLAVTQYGWQGAVLAATVIVFWMLLQFSRAMRALRQAAQHPVGSIDSAAMLASRLKRGMTMAQVLPLAKSLGRSQPADPGQERWRWTDGGGDALTLRFAAGALADWTLERAGPGS